MKGKLQELYERAERAAELDTSINGASRDYPAEAEARGDYARFQEKLLQLVRWNDESALSSYAHFDAAGREVTDRPLRTDDFIRIALKGTGKFDWVRVAAIDEAADETVLTVKPSYDPTAEKEAQNATSHFFVSEATNNFCLQRDGRTIHFYVIGLNEKANTDETGGLVETVRNAAVANLGYFFGVQKGEWTNFTRNFLELDEDQSK